MDEAEKALIEAAKEVAKEAYCDTVQPLAKQVGRTLETGGLVVNALISPVRNYVYNIQAREKQLEQEVSAKLEGIPAERLIEQAPLHIVVPAIQAWSYSIDCDELRNLYANLLANAMLRDKQSGIHPGFIEVIRQMHPLEAKIFEVLAADDVQPLGEIRGILNNGQDWLSITKHIVAMKINNEVHYPNALHWLNLERLGLINLDYGKRIAEEGAYEELEKFTNNDDIKKTAQEKNLKLVLYPGTVELTAFGKGFANICLRAPVANK